MGRDWPRGNPDATFYEQIRLENGAIGWDDWLFPASQLKKPGVSDPSYTNFFGSQWGQVFSEGNVGALDGAQLDHKFMVGSEINGDSSLYGQPHIHIILNNAPGSVGKTADFTVVLAVTPINGTMSEVTLTGTYTFDGTESQYQHIIFGLDQDVNTTGWTISSAGNATVTYESTGTYNSSVVFHSFDIHLPVNAPQGSTHPTSKD